MGREIRAASTLMALLAVVVLLHDVFTHKARIDSAKAGHAGLSGSMLTALPSQGHAWHGCGQSSTGVDERGPCDAMVMSRRSTILAGYQLPPTLVEAASIAPGTGRFTGEQPSRAGRCGRLKLSFLQIFRC